MIYRCIAPQGLLISDLLSLSSPDKQTLQTDKQTRGVYLAEFEALLSQHNVDFSHCVEKSELQEGWLFLFPVFPGFMLGEGC